MPSTEGGSFVAGSQAFVRARNFDPATGGMVAGHLRVDLDALPQLRIDLLDVQQRYDAIREKSAGLRHVEAPGLEAQSQETAAAIGRSAGEEPGQLGWCARRAYEEVGAMITEVDALIALYRDTEDENTMRT